MSSHDGRPTDWSELLRRYVLPGGADEAMRDRIAALERDLADRDKRIQELLSLVGDLQHELNMKEAGDE